MLSSQLVSPHVRSYPLSHVFAEQETREATRVLHEAFGKSVSHYFSSLAFSSEPDSLEYFLPALGDDRSLVEPFLLAHVKATIIGGQLFIAELPGTGIVGVALWFGPGQKLLSRFVRAGYITSGVQYRRVFSDEQRNAGWNQTMEVLNDACRKWWDNVMNLLFCSVNVCPES